MSKKFIFPFFVAEISAIIMAISQMQKLIKLANNQERRSKATNFQT